jgi:glycyl-tRNA synthetase
MVDSKEIVNLCKRRGFVFQSSEIYEGISGFWDYGPLGVLLKNNIRDSWWRRMVLCSPIGPDGKPVSIVGLDSSIIQHSNTWKASGHLDGFSDTMTDCKDSKKRYRVDQCNVFFEKTAQISHTNLGFVFHKEETTDNIAKKMKKLGKKYDETTYVSMGLEELSLEEYQYIYGPDTIKIGTLTQPRQFNLMFQTNVGPILSQENTAYLRPETAQGIFLNFKNVIDSSKARVPFGIAQIGKAFRNEVNPKNFLFRTREFEQMELEFFCHNIDSKVWHDFWINERRDWWISIGIDKNLIKLRKQTQEELAHYAKNGNGTIDIEYAFPFSLPNYGEIEGVSHRSNFDLSTHENFSGKSLTYRDLITNEKFIPDVIEPSAGLNRGFLALLFSAYKEDQNRPNKFYMEFPYEIAPVKASVFPLTNNPEECQLSEKIYMELRKNIATDFDTKQSIGKRYARADEIGVPFCITIDPQSLSDNKITIRHIKTMHQSRIDVSKIEEYIKSAKQ